MASEKTRFRLRWYHKFLIITLGLVITIAMIEVAARRYHLMPLPGDAEYREISKRVGPMLLSYERFENTSYLVGNTEFKVNVRLNKLNFRGDDIAKTPPEDATRIVLMGDSYTSGWAVESDEMWSTWLGKWLNSEGKKVDVANIGFPGWGTDREYLMYQSYGRKLNADIVMLVVYIENDVQENGISLWVDEATLADLIPFFTLNEAGELVEHPWNYSDKTRDYMAQAFPKNIIGWLNANSLSYRLSRDSLDWAWSLVAGDDAEQAPDPTVLSPLDEIDNPTYIPLPLESLFSEPDDDWAEAWKITAALLAAYRDAVEADGAEFVVAVIPAFPIVYHDEWTYDDLFDSSGRAWDVWYPQNRLMALLDDLDISVINPTQALLDYRATTGQRLYYHYDWHFTPTGTCVFGTILANELIDQGYIAGLLHDPLVECGTQP